MKTVLLLDQTVIGHKYAFAKLFTKYLLKLGYRVLLVLPEKTEQIYAELSESDPTLVKHLHPFDLEVNEKKRFGLGKRADAVLGCLSLWLSAKKAVKKAEALSNQKVDIVFFSWLDSYVKNFVSYRLIDLFFPYKWSGLFFHPWYLFNIGGSDQIAVSSRDSVLRSKNFIGCGVHDESLQSKLNKRTKKTVVYFPEIADGTTPEDSYELLPVIEEKSKSRPITGLIGLERRKGVLHLLDVIAKDSKREFFYFIAGEVPEEQYSASERDKIRKFLQHVPENVLYYDQPIPEGAKINAVISRFDVLFLVYDNFKSSSNFLTKGAIFRTLSVGIDSFWIGQNIEKYALGLTVQGDNADDTLEACRELVHKGGGASPKWDEYLELNGETSLEGAFGELFS